MKTAIKTLVLVLLSCPVVVLLVYPFSSNINHKTAGDIRILVWLSERYGANSFLNADVFEYYGWEITYAALSDSISPCPFSVIAPVMYPDIIITDTSAASAYNAIALMPSTKTFSSDPYRDILSSPAALQFVRDALAGGVVVSTVCSGLRVLAAADVVESVRVVGEPIFQAEYDSAGAIFLGNDHYPVNDGPIVTGARDQYYHSIHVQLISTAIEAIQGTGPHPVPPVGDFLASSDAGLVDDTVLWARTYGGAYADGGRALCETDDGGFLVAGYTFSQETGDADIMILRTDPEGAMLWSKIYGGRGTEYANGCLADNDGFLITGYTTSYGSGSKDMYLIKVDSAGDELWSHTYGGSSWDVGTSLCKVPDGGYLICGYTHSYGAGDEDVYIVRTDHDGGIMWTKTYGGINFELGNSIAPAGNGKYLIGATTGTYEVGSDHNSNAYLIIIDEEGNPLQTGVYGIAGGFGHGFDWCSSATPLTGGGCLLCGYTSHDDLMNAWLVKVDALGIQQWSRSIGGNFYDYGYAVRETYDGSYLIAGMTKSPRYDGTIYNNNVYVVKVDPAGNIVWQKNIGGPDSEAATAVNVAREGDYVITGYSRSSGSGSNDLLLMRLEGYAKYSVQTDVIPTQQLVAAGESASYALTTTYLTGGRKRIYLSASILPTPAKGTIDLILSADSLLPTDSCIITAVPGIMVTPGVYTINITVTCPEESLTIRREAQLTVIRPPMAMDVEYDHDGWQLVSLPLELTSPPHGSVFRFEGGYRLSDSMMSGNGYWQKITGLPVKQWTGGGVFCDTISLVRGWNIIGSISMPVATDSVSFFPHDLTVGPFIGFRDNQYFTADTIQPGHAYWVKGSDGGLLFLEVR